MPDDQGVFLFTINENQSYEMAGSSLFALIDDIATLLDDVSLMTKVAVKKTSGVLGDDLALNAQQVSGVRAHRELPVVWGVAKGSAINKLILVPLALTISALAPQFITPLLILGGLYLCYEGVEKIWHSLFHKTEKNEHKAKLRDAAKDPKIDLLLFEQEKIKGAIRTDFVLSAEIIVIALGTVASQPFINQVLVVSLIAVGMTVGVYGLVALIVKLDDIGLHLQSGNIEGVFGKFKQVIGGAILAFCPFMMKSLSVIGTVAMFLVGGGIITHGVAPVHHLIETLIQGVVFPGFVSVLANLIVGVIAGAAVLLIVNVGGIIKSKVR